LVRHLDSLPEKDRAVELLYISYDSEVDVEREKEALLALYQPDVCERTPGPDPSLIVQSPPELAFHAVMRVLVTAAATLRIVHIHCEDRDFIFFPIAMPALEELTLEGSHFCMFEPYEATLPVWPALTRLKLTCVSFSTTDADGDKVDSIVRSVTKVAPRLSHLYIEYTSQDHARLAHNLNAWLLPASPHHIATLKRLFVGPTTADSSHHYGCGTGAVRAAMEKRRIADYALANGRIVLLPGCRWSKHAVEEARAEGEWDWLDRIGGGLGTWVDVHRVTRSMDFVDPRRAVRPRRNEPMARR